jgi:tetratricopeptide (TPR) repeat protein
MPKTPSDIPHVAATHHRVGIHQSPPAAPADPAEFLELKPMSDVSKIPKAQQLRNLGLAFLQLSLTQESPRLADETRREALSALRVAQRLLPEDGDLLAGLAYCFSVEDSRQTIEFAEQALQRTSLTPRGRIRALFVLSDAYCRLQEPDQALERLEQLVGLRRQGADWFRLAVCRDLTGNHAGALEAALHAAEIMPTDPKFHDLVVEIAEKLGETIRASEHRRLARQLRIVRGPGGLP